MSHRAVHFWGKRARRGLLFCLLVVSVGCASTGGDGGQTMTVTVADPPAADKPYSLADTGTATVPTRENVSDFVKDPAKVAAYRKALETMRRNSAADPSTVEFRTSLLFWANTHGYFGTGGNATSFPATVQRRLPQCLQYFQSSPYRFSLSEARATCQRYYNAASQEFTPDSFADGIWGTCQHTTSATEDTPRFLPWHRLYLYYYERTLRKYSWSNDFALPYWDYFDYSADSSPPDGPPNLWLPPLVSEGGSTAANTFYDELRTLWLNDQRTSMSPENATAKDAFALDRFVDFSNSLEGVPHGTMHCATGNGCTAPHIGWVPVAGNDPVFYMHHANIDRLWQCWMNREAGGDPIDLEWAKANLGMPDSWYDISYVFADENGTRVTKTIADAFSPEVLAVRYAEEVNCRIDSDVTVPNLALATIASVDERIERPELVLMSRKVDLATQATQVELHPEVNLLQERQAPARSLVQSSDGAPRSGVWLVLENVKITEAPSYTYNVYISSKTLPDRRALVTRFQFFGFGDHGAHGGEGQGDDATNWGTKRFFLNDDISEIGVTSVEDLDVHFVPTHAVTGEPLDQEGGESLISIESVRLITLPGSD